MGGAVSIIKTIKVDQGYIEILNIAHCTQTPWCGHSLVHVYHGAALQTLFYFLFSNAHANNIRMLLLQVDAAGKIWVSSLMLSSLKCPAIRYKHQAAGYNTL